MISMAEARRFNHNIKLQSTKKLQSILDTVNSITCELTVPQIEIKKAIEEELKERENNNA